MMLWSNTHIHTFSLHEAATLKTTVQRWLTDDRGELKKKWNNFEIINNYCVSWRLQINKNTFLKLTWSRHRVRLEAELTIVQWQESDFSDCVRTVCWCRHLYSWHGVVSSNDRNTKGNNNRLWQERIQWQAGSYKNPWGNVTEQRV